MQPASFDSHQKHDLPKEKAPIEPDKIRELGKRVAKDAAIKGKLLTRVQHFSGPYRGKTLGAQNKEGINPVIFMEGNACLHVADLKVYASDPLIDGAFLKQMYQEVEHAAKGGNAKAWEEFQKEYDKRVKRRERRIETSFKASDILPLVKLIEGIDKKFYAHYSEQIETRLEQGKKMLKVLDNLTVPYSYQFDKNEYHQIIADTAEAFLLKMAAGKEKPTPQMLMQQPYLGYYRTFVTSLHTLFEGKPPLLAVKDIADLKNALQGVLRASGFKVEDISALMSLFEKKTAKYVQKSPSFISWSELKPKLESVGVKSSSHLQNDLRAYIDRQVDLDLSEKLAYKASPEINREALAYDLASSLHLESALIPKKKTYLGITLQATKVQKSTRAPTGSVSSFVKGTQVVKALSQALDDAKSPTEKASATQAFFDRINLDSYQALLVLSLLVCEMDGHEDQYNVDLQGHIQSIDMGRHSPPALTVKIPSNPDQHLLTMRCCLLDFPQMNRPLTKGIREKILALDPKEVSRQLDQMILPPEQRELKNSLRRAISSVDTMNLIELKKLWTTWAKPMKGEMKVGAVPLDQFTKAEELRPLVKILLETKLRKLIRQQNAFRYLQPKAKEKIVERLKAAQKHIRETSDPTSDSLFRALYPDVGIVCDAIRSIPDFQLHAGVGMGMTENTLELFYKFIEQNKYLDPKQLAELKGAIERLSKDSMTPDEIKAITLLA